MGGKIMPEIKESIEKQIIKECRLDYIEENEKEEE